MESGNNSLQIYYIAAWNFPENKSKAALLESSVAQRNLRLAPAR